MPSSRTIAKLNGCRRQSQCHQRKQIASVVVFFAMIHVRYARVCYQSAGTFAFFCQTDTKAQLINGMTKAMSNQILPASHLDCKIHVQLAGVIDLIVAEAKYHLTCLSKFTSSTTKVKQDSADTDLAMVWLCKESKGVFIQSACTSSR